jgi:hypothetical protein
MSDKQLLKYSAMLDGYIYIGGDDKPHVACRGIEKILRHYESHREEIKIN